MDSKDLKGLMEAYQRVHAPEQLDEISSHLALTASQKADEERRKAAISGDKARAAKKVAQASRLYKGVGPRKARERAAANEEVQNVDEATAMAKRGYDEAPIRQKIAKSTGGGGAADRATALEKKPTYGNDKVDKQRSELARKQRTDFRKTTSSSPGLHGYGHKSNDPAVKAKQAARGAQRGVLTPNEKKELNREEFDIFDVVLEFLQVEGFAETLEEAEWMMANVIDEEAIDIILGEGIIAAVKAGSKRHKDAMTAAGKAIKKTRKNVEDLGKALKPATDTAKSAAIGVGKAAKATYAAGKKTGEFTRKGAQRHSDMMKAAKKVFSKEELELIAQIMIDEGYDLSEYTWEEFHTLCVESQYARENPEKYEREQAKKYAPVRGEKTPMPPRGDKRREEFEKWYAKQMGR